MVPRNSYSAWGTRPSAADLADHPDPRLRSQQLPCGNRLAGPQALRCRRSCLARSRRTRTLTAPEGRTITALDSSPPDDREDAPDRRVELFFFDAEFGIEPPPPGKNSAAGSPQYRAWRDQAELLEDLDAPGPELPAVCQVALTLERFDGTPLSNAVFQLTTPDGLFTNKTDSNGNLTVPDLPPDDYLLQVGALNQFVSAIANSEARRTIRFAAASVDA